MELLCSLCECCFQEEGHSGCMAITYCFFCCFEAYKGNISGKKRRTYRYWNFFLILIFSIVSAVLAAIILSKTASSNQQITNIFENWQLGVLIDIQIVEFCPSDYEILSIHQMPGTTIGCVCQDDSEIDTDECSDWEKFTGCYEQKPKGPIDLFKWVQPSNNSFYAVQICGLRSQLKFYDLLQSKITTEEDCKTNGYRVCQTQSPEHFYCVLQEEPCPIRDIIITQSQLSEYDLQQNNYSLIYDKGFYAYTSLSKETTPLLNMVIVKGKGVCFDQNQISLNQKLSEDYPLFTPSPEDCILDSTYYQISTTNEKDLFIQNNVISLVQSERPLYNISKNIEYQLLAQNQLDYRQDCRINNFQQLIELSSKFEQQNTLITCQLVFACFLFCVVMVLIINELLRCFYKDCSKYYSIVQQMIKEISIYLFAITVIVGYSLMIDLVLKVEEQNSKNCLPSNGQERMNIVYQGLVSASLPLSYCLLINVGLMIIIDFVMSTFICLKLYKNECRLPKISFQRRSSYYYKYYVNQNQNPQQNQNPNENQNPNQNQNPHSDQSSQINQNPNENQILYQNQNPYLNQNSQINQNPYVFQNHQQNNPFQFQQNPAPQQFDYQVNNNNNPQQYYIQNQAPEAPEINIEQQFQVENPENQIIKFDD